MRKNLVVGALLVGLVTSLMVGCRREPSAAEIRERSEREHVAAEVQNCELEVRSAELDEQIAREKGVRIDPAPLLKARARLEAAQAMLRMQQDGDQLQRDLDP